MSCKLTRWTVRVAGPFTCWIWSTFFSVLLTPWAWIVWYHTCFRWPTTNVLAWTTIFYECKRYVCFCKMYGMNLIEYIDIDIDICRYILCVRVCFCMFYVCEPEKETNWKMRKHILWALSSAVRYVCTISYGLSSGVYSVLSITYLNMRLPNKWRLPARLWFELNPSLSSWQRICLLRFFSNPENQNDEICILFMYHHSEMYYLYI